MILSDLENKNLAIWGLGREGIESYHTLRALFPAKPLLLINRERPDNIPDDDLTSFIPEADLKDNIGPLDVVIKTPGISLYHPLVTMLKQHGVTITSATNIWFANRRKKATTIAVTGSNGKSTTCALLQYILSGLGHKTELGGNIGTPLLSLDKNAEYYVIELSSYQTADLDQAPDIAVLLNLFPEHIDWHQSHEQYFTDKINLILTGAKIIILNRTDPRIKAMITGLPADGLWFNDPCAIHYHGKFIWVGDDSLGLIEDITLPGNHNLENICAALTVCKALGLDLKKSFKLAASYSGLPHRLENLGITAGRTYINDSISTTPEATIAALKSFEGRPVTLLAGGQNRNQDYSSLARYIKDHPGVSVITAYQTGPAICLALNKIGLSSSVVTAIDLKTSVAIAKKTTPDGGIILLSPAAPSYDAFENFEQRGDLFRIYSLKTG
ncbi:MAG: UDP-N-acetylmuramoyl-L-alanine--D-glutamate ligase [Alphaproteobacteria bacterium]|nr:MAG: UDP-N-acetylmuramoyl-L-alanine--D-glutamate ligase [Alphaproteobacteria bacterium]